MYGVDRQEGYSTTWHCASERRIHAVLQFCNFEEHTTPADRYQSGESAVALARARVAQSRLFRAGARLTASSSLSTTIWAFDPYSHENWPFTSRQSRNRESGATSYYFQEPISTTPGGCLRCAVGAQRRALLV